MANRCFSKVHTVSKVCPFHEFVQSLSNIQFWYFKSSKYEPWTLFPRSKVCPDTVQCKNWHDFKLIRTEFGQVVDFYIQSLSNLSWAWRRFDRTLTRLGQQLDRPSTWPFFGQTFDKTLTLFGQRLDFLSSPCPTTHWLLVPTNVRVFCGGRWLMVLGRRRRKLDHKSNPSVPLFMLHFETDLRPSVSSRRGNWVTPGICFTLLDVLFCVTGSVNLYSLFHVVFVIPSFSLFQ